VEARLAMRAKDHRMSGEEFAQSYRELLRNAAGVHDSKMEKIDFYGIPVYRFTWRSGGAPGDEDDDKDDDDTEKADPGEVTKTVAYAFPTFNRAYVVYGEAPLHEFDAVAPYFEEIAKNLEIIPENRW
ncbi:MAG: hypothetical protein AAF488_19365, partial [Planctomycetota bacterium]